MAGSRSVYYGSCSLFSKGLPYNPIRLASFWYVCQPSQLTVRVGICIETRRSNTVNSRYAVLGSPFGNGSPDQVIRGGEMVFPSQVLIAYMSMVMK